MMLSFSISEMRPLIEAGLRERAGTHWHARSKRQTIRRRGPVWQRVLAASEGGAGKGGRVERDLHLWWKSRTPARELLGVVRGFEIFPVTIFHGAEDGLRPRETGFVSVTLHDVTVSHPSKPRALEVYDQARVDAAAYALAYRDGFDEWLDFVRFFVPTPGDRFIGALIKW